MRYKSETLDLVKQEPQRSCVQQGCNTKHFQTVTFIKEIL